ncbi:uncharacterized protein METZ01_LOCUS156481, partial [marine metagenome]
MKAERCYLNIQMTCPKTLGVRQLSSIGEVFPKAFKSFGKFVALLFSILVFQNGGFYSLANEIESLESREQNVCEDCDSVNLEIVVDAKNDADQSDSKNENIGSDVSNTDLDELGIIDDQAPEATERLTTEELYQKGQAHEAGDGAIKNASLAWSYYHQAGERDHVLSHYRLAEMSFHGIGVPVNYARAAEWYERAAVAGNAQAQRMLGKMYIRGTGVARDSYKGQYWLEKAKENGVGAFSREEEAILVPVSMSDGDAPVEVLLGESRLDVKIEGSLSVFGNEVGSTLNELLANLYSVLSEDKGLELTFLTDGKVRVWEQDGEVVISWPSLTYVVRKTATTNAISTLYVETPAMDYSVHKAYSPLSRQDDDQTLLNINLPTGNLLSIRDGNGVVLLEVSASGGVIVVGWSKSLKIVTRAEINWRDAKVHVPVVGLHLGAGTVMS